MYNVPLPILKTTILCDNHKPSVKRTFLSYYYYDSNFTLTLGFLNKTLNITRPRDCYIHAPFARICALAWSSCNLGAMWSNA